uniref:VanZ family protein n=1 Tax=Roseihalotalea indica TaxID=2867963 RepID=A0AA49GH51_9BACT|nr:VanZ family protein [Tunicatimonas sp. TK19036]
MAITTNTTYLKYILLVLYFVVLIWVLFFINIPPFVRSPLRFQDVPPQLIPFGSVFHFFTSKSFDGKAYFILSNVIGNIVLFIPLGIFIAWIWGTLHLGLKATAFTILISTTAELLQYTFYLGVFDIDDILFNTLGGWIGYMLIKWSDLDHRLRKKRG